MAFAWNADLSEKQYRSLLGSNARLNIWHGSVRSSKTIMSIVRWIEYIKIAPHGKLLMIGKTERTLKRNILDVIQEMVGNKNYRLKQGSGEVVIYGRTIDIIGANDERAEGKIRGSTVAGAYGDELTLWPESFFKMLLSRLSVRGAKFFGTTNPDGPYHWLKEGYIDRTDLNLIAWHFTLDDNPSLDPEYVASLKKEYTGLWYKRFIQGLWVLAEGAIYDMFDEEIHAIDELPEDVEIVRYSVGIDYGTTNPCVFILIGEDGEGNFYAIKEYYWSSKEKGYQKTDSAYADDLIAFIEGYNIERIYIDPSAASFIAELRSREIAGLTEANNDVLDGIRTVAKMVGNGFIKILKACKNLLREFTAYVWDPKSQKLGVDKPLKENDHALDALRYFVYTRLLAPTFDIW